MLSVISTFVIWTISINFFATEVLKYHVVPGRRPASALGTGALYTLHGTPVNITIGAGQKINVKQ
jgi:uncharacterized surface protein with fasciclin (FAS1) repeats